MSMDQPKVETIKKFVGFSRLWRPSTIYLIFIYFITTSAEVVANAAVTKCCQRDQVISVADGYICVYYGDHLLEIYPLRNQGIRRDNDNLMSCGDSGSWGIMDIKGIADVEINRRNSCVDIFYNHRLGEIFPIVFVCFNQSIKIGEVRAHYKTTKFETLRTCCGKHGYFDRDLRECTMRREEFNVTRFLNFLDGRFDFVTVVPKPPACKHAILDYIVNVTTDLRVLANGSIEIVLPTNDGPRKILAEQENTCLDPDPSNPDLMTVRACSDAQFCSDRRNMCVRKCCPEDEFYGKQGCEKNPTHAPPVYFHDFFKNVSIKMASAAFMDARNPLDYGLLIGIDCKYGMNPREQKDLWYFTARGQIYFPFTRYYEHHEYCFDMIYGDPNHAEDIHVFLCSEGPQTVGKSEKRKWSGRNHR